MTEQQWLSSTSPAEMLDFIRPQASERKLRLFCIACNLAWKGMTTVTADFCEQHGEQFELTDVAWAEQWCNTKHTDYPADERCLLLRLIFNPFRRVELPRTKIERAEKNPNGPGGTIYLSCPWQTPDVLSVAQTAYETRDATLFGPFWDALETAGCDNEEIRRALAWEQRCPKCLGEGWVTIRIASFFEPLGKGTPVKDKCLTCNGTGWLPIPGGPFMVRGFWPVDLMLGLQ